MPLEQLPASQQKTDTIAIFLGCLLITVITAFTYTLVNKNSDKKKEESVAIACSPAPLNSECGLIRQNTINVIGQTVVGMGEDQMICGYNFETKKWLIPEMDQRPPAATQPAPAPKP